MFYKKEYLSLFLNRCDSLIVAFSGGVDSTYLLAEAYAVLKNNVIAVTAESPIHPGREKKAAIEFIRNRGIRHIIINSREMNAPDFTDNRRDRCYICKKMLFQDILAIASNLGVQHVAHGTNTDDLDDFRPGLAAADELGIVAPLLNAKMTKHDIRLLSKDMRLKTWNKPAMACLATRIPYGTLLTPKKLKAVEQAEDVLLHHGFTQCRVRHHGNVAMIEINSADFEKILDNNIKYNIINQLKALGFSHVGLNMEGYIRGSLNRFIN